MLVSYGTMVGYVGGVEGGSSMVVTMEEQVSNELYQSIGARIRIVDMGQLDILVTLGGGICFLLSCVYLPNHALPNKPRQLVVSTAIEISLVIVFLLPIKVPFNQRVSHSPSKNPRIKE